MAENGGVGNKDYLARLHHIISSVGGNSQAAAIMKKSVKSIERYKRGSEIPLDAAYLLTQAADVTVEWLNSGMESRGFYETHKKQQNSDGFIRPKSTIKGSSQQITTEMVEEAVRHLLEYVLYRDESIEPAALGKLAGILCEMGVKEGAVDMETVERLLSIRG